LTSEDALLYFKMSIFLSANGKGKEIICKWEGKGKGKEKEKLISKWEREYPK